MFLNILNSLIFFSDIALPANKVCGLYNLPTELEEKFDAILKS